jgi:drug/metabolite transporter (DMT)-like permease
VAVLAVSWGSILARYCQSGPLTIAFFRLAFTTLILLPFTSLFRQGSMEWKVWKLLPAMAGAGLLLGLHFATWISSLNYTSVGSSVLLVSTQPIFGLVLSAAFLAERPSSRTIVGVLVALGGIVIVTVGDLAVGREHLTGDLLALAGGGLAAGYLLVGRALRSRLPLVDYLAWVSGLGAVTLGILVAVTGEWRLARLQSDWLWLLLMAAGPSVAGHGLLNWSVRRMRAYVVNAALLGEPILATGLAWLLLGERPGRGLLGGGILVVAGLIWVFKAEEPRAQT